MSRALGLALALLCACCARPLPSARVPAPRVLRIAVEPDMGPWRRSIADGARILARGGVPTVLVARDAAHDVLVRHGDDAAEGCAYAGMYYAETRQIGLWPPCWQGYLQGAAVVAHELLHALHGMHVCVARDQPADGGCSPCGYGIALLNPRVPAPPSSCDAFREACADADEQLTLTALDRCELRRVGALPPVAR